MLRNEWNCGQRLFRRTVVRYVAALGALALAALGRAEPAGPTIRSQEPWADWFGGQEAALHFVVTAPAAFQGRLEWSFSTSGRTLARREQAVAIEAAHAQIVEIRLPIPEVKPGVVVDAALTLALVGTEAAGAHATLQRPIRIFPKDPFVDRAVWLKKLDIALFDPEGRTATLFEKAGIPFRVLRDQDAIENLKTGLLVVGEGVSFRAQRGLGARLPRLAARGVPVLCLAPAEGAFPMPGVAAEDQPMPSSVRLDGPRMIARLNKRLDAETWPPDGRIARAGFTLQAERAGIVASVTEGAMVWSWIEARYPHHPRGRLIVCAFEIVTRWEAGPAPRYCLAELLDYATKPGDE